MLLTFINMLYPIKMVGSCCFSHNLLVLIGFAPGGATGLIGSGCRWGLARRVSRKSPAAAVGEPRNAEFHYQPSLGFLSC